jgi:hypothetical protein
LRSDEECTDGSSNCVCLKLSIWWNWNTLTLLFHRAFQIHWISYTN